MFSKERSGSERLGFVVEAAECDGTDPICRGEVGVFGGWSFDEIFAGLACFHGIAGTLRLSEEEVDEGADAGTICERTVAGNDDGVFIAEFEGARERVDPASACESARAINVWPDLVEEQVASVKNVEFWVEDDDIVIGVACAEMAEDEGDATDGDGVAIGIECLGGSEVGGGPGGDGVFDVGDGGSALFSSIIGCSFGLTDGCGGAALIVFNLLLDAVLGLFMSEHGDLAGEAMIAAGVIGVMVRVDHERLTFAGEIESLRGGIGSEKIAERTVFGIDEDGSFAFGEEKRIATITGPHQCAFAGSFGVNFCPREIGVGQNGAAGKYRSE